MSESATPPWTLRCDGGARGNPGPGAIGYVLSDPQGNEVEAIGRRIGTATNNVAEYQALIAGLEAAARHGAQRLLVYMDSELVVRQMRGEYRVKNAGLKPLYQRAVQAASPVPRVRYVEVPRADNARADQLVNEALDGASEREGNETESPR